MYKPAQKNVWLRQMSPLLARKLGIHVVHARPAWRDAAADVAIYAIVGIVTYVLFRLAHGDVDDRDDNYCLCMAAVAVAVAAWLS